MASAQILVHRGLGLVGSGFEGLRKVGYAQCVAIDGRRAIAVQRRAILTVRSEKRVKVRLLIDHQVPFGETHAILGSSPCTGHGRRGHLCNGQSPGGW